MCLARGYVGRPSETAARFIPDSVVPSGGMRGGNNFGERMYKTGDLARHLATGEIEFLGRIDSQVQIRGFRVELGEVAAVITRHPQVREVAVVDLPDGATRRLAAYFVAQDEAPTTGQLRGFLREALPEYMVPQAFVALAELPLTVGGKVDRKALPAPTWGHADDFVAPRTATEELVAEIWKEVLDVERVSAGDDFFDLGGHSLLATRVVSRLRDSLGVELEVRRLFENPTVEALAEVLASRTVSVAGALPAITAVPRGDEPPASFAQERLWFLDQMTPGDVSYNMPAAIRLSGQLEVEAFSAALTAIVRRHEVLRTTFEARASELVQAVSQAPPPRLPRLDLSGLDGTRREAVARQLAREEARRPFDLAGGPLVRTTLVVLGPAEHVLYLTFHHIVSDGWSVGVYLRELATFYRAAVEGAPASTAPLAIQYADFAAWQRGWLSGRELERQTAYWRRQLDGAPKVIDLPLDRPRPAVLGQEGGNLVTRLPDAAIERCDDRSRTVRRPSSWR